MHASNFTGYIVTSNTATEKAAVIAEALTITESVEEGLNELPRYESSLEIPELRRLYRASKWWCDAVPSFHTVRIAARKFTDSCG